METSVCIITPDDARKLLASTQFKNRPVKREVINMLVRTIQNNKWRLTHQGIGIDIHGNVIDGQHRLLACIKADRAIPVLVTRGLMPDDYVVIDKGPRRSVCDSLDGLGVRNTRSLAAFLLLVLHHRDGINPPFGRKYADDEVISLYNTDRDVFDNATRYGLTAYKCEKLAAVSLISFAMYVTKDKTFMDAIFYEDATERPHICIMLRKRLIKNLTSKEKLSARDTLALMIKTWNFYVAGKTPAVLKWAEGQGEEYPAFEVMQ